MAKAVRVVPSAAAVPAHGRVDPDAARFGAETLLALLG